MASRRHYGNLSLDRLTAFMGSDWWKNMYMVIRIWTRDSCRGWFRTLIWQKNSGLCAFWATCESLRTVSSPFFENPILDVPVYHIIHYNGGEKRRPAETTRKLTRCTWVILFRSSALWYHDQNFSSCAETFVIFNTEMTAQTQKASTTKWETTAGRALFSLNRFWCKKS